jgi:uncharacterized membrane protein
MSEESKSTRGKRLDRLPLVPRVSLADDNDLVVILLATAVTLVVIVTPYVRDSVIRSAFGVLFTLFIPGYSLVAALFPRKEDLSTFERLALSFGLSVSTVPLISLALNYTLHITLGSLVITLTCFVLLCVLAAKIRRDAIPADERFAFSLDHVRRMRAAILPDSATRFDRIVSLVLIASILTTATAFAYVVAMPKQGEHFTQFYLLGSDRLVDNYPTQYQLNQSKPIIVGVVNHEQREANYTLVVTLNDSVNQHTLYSEQLTLADNQTWEKTILLQPDMVGTNMKMDFLLYLDNNTAPYRENYLWVNVTRSA